MEYIELRSDTFTFPTKGMYQAMNQAKLGDDVFNEDPTVKELEEKLAKIFGMEAGLFCSSGTMTNQIAIATHVGKGEELICDENSHIYYYEQGGIMANANASVKLGKGEYGKLSLEQIKKLRAPADIHFCETKLLSLENTANRGGGSCYSTESLTEISQYCKDTNLPLHLDGARVFNAIIAKNQNPKQYGEWFDSISVCLSKGLGAPVGSVLLGTEAFIAKAKRIRKRFGGGWRQAGLLAACGIYALDHHIERLAEDHLRAKIIGEELLKRPWVDAIYPVETNIVIASLREDLLAKDLLEKLKENGIRAIGFGEKQIRFVTHLNFTDQDLTKFIQAIQNI